MRPDTTIDPNANYNSNSTSTYTWVISIPIPLQNSTFSTEIPTQLPPTIPVSAQFLLRYHFQICPILRHKNNSVCTVLLPVPVPPFISNSTLRSYYSSSSFIPTFSILTQILLQNPSWFLLPRPIIIPVQSQVPLSSSPSTPLPISNIQPQIPIPHHKSKIPNPSLNSKYQIPKCPFQIPYPNLTSPSSSSLFIPSTIQQCQNKSHSKLKEISRNSSSPKHMN